MSVYAFSFYFDFQFLPLPLLSLFILTNAGDCFDAEELDYLLLMRRKVLEEKIITEPIRSKGIVGTFGMHLDFIIGSLRIVVLTVSSSEIKISVSLSLCVRPSTFEISCRFPGFERSRTFISRVSC